MFFSSKKVGDAASGRQQLLEKARAEKALRDKERSQKSHVLIVQRFLRGCAVRRAQSRSTRIELNRKLHDLDALRLMLSTKGINFLPPSAPLQQLLVLALTSNSTISLASDAEGTGLLGRLCCWVSRSIDAATPAAQNLALRPGCSRQISRLVRLACTAATNKAASPEHRLNLLSFVLVACGGSAGSPSTEPLVSASVPLHASVRQQLSSSSAPSSIRFIEHVARAACYLVNTDFSGKTVSTALDSSTATDSNVASKAIEISLHIAATGATPSERTASYSSIVACILTVPWVAARIQNTPAYTLLSQASWLELFALSYHDAPLRLMNADEGLPTLSAKDKPVASPRQMRATPSFAPAPVAQSSSAALTPPIQSSASPVASISGYVPFEPVHNAGSILGHAASGATGRIGSAAITSTSAAGSASGSFFDSALAKSASSAASGADSVESAAIAAWPPAAYLLGNLLQLLVDAPPAAPSASPSPRGSNAMPFTALDHTAAVCAMSVIASLVESLPDDVWSTAVPIIWPSKGAMTTPAGAGDDAPTAPLTPQPMPQRLIVQIRRLSSERLAKAAARLACIQNTAALKHPRLRMADEDDPEQGTYDAYTIDPRLGRVDKSSSNLVAAPSTAGTIVRSVWEGSKLAISFLRRLGSKNAEGASTAAAASAAAATAARQPLPSLSSALSPRQSAAASSSASSAPAFDDEAVYAFCRLYCNLLAPRVHQHGHSRIGSSSDAEPVIGRIYLLSALAFSPDIELAKSLWYFMTERVDIPSLVKTRAFKCGASTDGAFGVLTLFATIMGHLSLVIDDFELYQRNTPLPLRELRHAARLIRDVIAHAEGVGVDAFNYPAARSLLLAPASHLWPRFCAAGVSLLRSLYDRHSTRPLGPPDMWIVDTTKVSLCMMQAAPDADGEMVKENDHHEAFRRLMAVLPFSVPFSVRADRYDATRDADRNVHQRGQPQVKITVQRQRLFESSYAALNGIRGDALRRKIYVTFINDEGLEESGIDAGGLFKELWTSLAKLVFDPSYGLWKSTEGGEMYPNPASQLCTGMDDGASFEFLGRVLGKALYEGITIGPQFARFFLHRVAGRAVHLHHLPSLDPELYKSLMFLKTYEGDVSDLCLSFTISSEMGGGGGGGSSASSSSGDQHQAEVELVPGGAHIPVTNSNRMQYIHMVADHRLNASIERQTTAFLRGLRDVLPGAWLTPFSAPELQVLISGSLGGIDADDLRANTQYAGGYFAADRCIKDFWAIFASFSDKDKAALLKFTTSCERAPPLGFRQLEPRFTIQRIQIRRDDDALPSSSTCFHILKLPSYSSQKVMREKLLMSIHSGAGFELT